MRSRREWLALPLLAAVGIGMALLALEGGVRLLHLVPDRFWEPDALLGAKLVPGARGWWTQEEHEFVVPVQINSRGLRDVEHAVAKPAGTERILLLGDSFVEALHVPLEKSVGRLLEADLNRAAAPRRVEVVSAGVSGYGTAAEVLFFESALRNYRPDVVVLMFYPGNDVKNNSPTLEDTLVPVYDADGKLLKIQGERKTAARGWRALLARSKAYRFARQLLLTRQPGLAERLMKWGLLSRQAVRTAPQREGMPVDYGVYATTPSPEWDDAWRRTEANLDRLSRAVSAVGARFVVAVLSSREQVYPQAWEEILAAHPGMRQRSWDHDAPQTRVAAWAAAHTVPCLLLAPKFREEARKSAALLHYRNDGHWTPEGHRLAATVIEQFLNRQPDTTPE